MPAANRRKKKTSPAPTRPTVRPSDQVRSVVLRMGVDFLAELDELCEVNKRSRREIVEILVHEASDELKHEPEARINP